MTLALNALAAVDDYARLALPLAGIALITVYACATRPVLFNDAGKESKAVNPAVSAARFPFILVIMALGIAWLSYEFTRLQRHSTSTAAMEELSTIADLKARQLDDWLKERKGDARTLGSDRHLGQDVALYSALRDPRGRAAGESAIKKLQIVRDAYDYHDVMVTDRNGAVALSASGRGAVNLQARSAVRCALKTGDACISSYRVTARSGDTHVEIVLAAPVKMERDDASGAVLLVIDAERQLYPLVQDWPVPSATGEVLLAAVDEEAVTYFNRTRHGDAPVMLARPLVQEDLLALLLARGLAGATEGTDYRGVAAVGAGRRLKQAPWVLVAKQDSEEIYGRLRDSQRIVLAMTTLFIAACGLIAFWWWRMHVVIAQSRLPEHPAREETMAPQFHYLTRHAGDLVLLLDDSGTIIECSDQAAQAYGYTRSELEGIAMSDLRAPGATPKFKACERASDGLTYEICHRRRDGSLFPAEVSIRLVEAHGRRASQAIIRDISERKRKEAKLQLDAPALEHARDAILVTDAEGRIISVNRAFTELTGYEPSDVVGRNPRMLSSGRHDHAFYEAMWRSVKVSGYWQGEIWNRKKDGEVFAERQTITSVFDDDGRLTHYVSMFSEITERRHAEDQLRFQAHVLGMVGEAIIATDPQQRITYWNRQAEELYGWIAQEVTGRTLPGVMSTEASRARMEALLREVRTGHAWSGELEGQRREGPPFIAHITLSPMFGHDGGFDGYIAVSRDITARKRAEERLEFLARYDTLTGLPNRNLFRDRLTDALDRASRAGRTVGLIFFDLDRFKQVNDTLGHAAGDALLTAVSGRLQEQLPDVHTVARLGGDEFTIIVDDLEQRDQLAAVARRVLDLLAQPVAMDGVDIYVTASIGLTVFPDDAQDVDGLVQAADMAMYQAKNAGRNNYEFYSSARATRSPINLTMEAELRQALERGEFSLVYQPRLAAEDHHVIAVEALLRWNSAHLGIVRPEHFIQLAEETGLIVPIGNWVLTQACLQWKAWRDVLPVAVSVNLSALQFQNHDSIPRLLSIVRETGMDPAHLEFEITETTVMRDAAESVRKMTQLRDAGVRLSIDDFGTGYSSLAYLKQFPVDALKIDKSFVHELPADGDSSAIVKAIVSMAKNLKLRVVAEGVETVEQLRFLRLLGCDEYQGFYFSHPLDSDETVTYVKRHHETQAPAPRGRVYTFHSARR
ncbi:MAG: EAL domain-containing protein [Rhodospirillaceae bacterium]